MAKSDVIYAMIDNTVASAMMVWLLLQIKRRNQYLPPPRRILIAVQSLVWEAYYYQVGIQTADYVAAILEGKKPSDLPVKIAKASDLIINKQAAEKLGLRHHRLF